MKRFVSDLARSFGLHHARSTAFLEGIGLLGTVAFPAIYLLRFTGSMPPLYNDLPWRLPATLLCLFMAIGRFWPQRLRRYYLPYSYFTVFYALGFLLPFTMLQNKAATPSMVNMVVSAVFIILLTDWRNTIVMMVGGYVAAFSIYWFTTPEPTLPSSFLVWWVPMSAVLVAGGSISKYVEKRAELERMRRIYSGLAGSIAHEVRTPLSQAQHTLEAVDAFLQRALSGRSPGLPAHELRELCSTVSQGQHAVARGLQSVTLTLQQVNGKPLDTSGFKPLSAARCVERAVDEYAYTSAKERERVVVRATEDFHFRGDETVFVLILFNLLKNALYYLPTHPQARITITVESTPVHRVVVHDTGPGIAPEVMPRLFEEFHSSGKSEGTGLGLAFCRRAMHAFAGDISCKSSPGKFTEFIMTFPPLPAGEPVVTQEPAPAPAKDALAGHTVLVVDDSAFNRAIVKARLRALGMQAIEAQHGGEALQIIDDGARPAAILMDLEMPGIGGLEATRALRRRPAPASRIPVLALSANDLPSWREAAQAVGTDGYLTKPLQAELLASELARVLKLGAAEADLDRVPV